MTKYLQYDYEDDDGTIVHVNEPRENRDGWNSPFVLRQWMVLAMILAAVFGGIAYAVNSSRQHMDQEEQYSDCIIAQFPNGDPAVCGQDPSKS